MKLAKKIVKLLKQKKLRLGIAESCTGGMLSSSITSIEGSSKIFNIGLITYSNQSKFKILKIKKDIISKYGAVSPQCCYSMVNNLSKISNAKLNISITGIAGPKGGSRKKPVGLVYIGVKKGSKIKIYKNIFKKKNRQQIQRNAVNKSLKIIFDLVSSK